MKDECYEFIKGPNNKVSIVGFGSYGEVKLARNTETGEMVAIKMIYGRNSKEEIDVHHKLNHPKIIRLLNYYYQKEKNTTYMVLEYAQGGTLHNRIKFGYGQLPKDKVRRYFRDVCMAVEYLHSLKYMHRDIKPENILLTKDDHAKLCDFGFAAILQYRSTLCGTYEYMAPEMIQEKPYDHKVDIWALGILLFELIQGTAPFRGESGQDVINEMKKPIVFSSRFDKDQIELIKKILRVNAQNRPEVTAILEHPYLAQITQSEKTEKGSNAQSTTRAISNWSNQLAEPPKPEPKTEQTQAENNQQRRKKLIPSKPETKQFKHFVPQASKSSGYGQGNTVKPPSNYVPNSQPYQALNLSSQSLLAQMPGSQQIPTEIPYRGPPASTQQTPLQPTMSQTQKIRPLDPSKLGYPVAGSHPGVKLAGSPPLNSPTFVKYTMAPGTNINLGQWRSG